MCLPPMTISYSTYTNCMRLLPDKDYSKEQDFGYKQGEKISVMTYLTSRDPNVTD
jgi:hypothetical protein